jgi:glycosyltransferase involved in cell wall biosynthesis
VTMSEMKPRVLMTTTAYPPSTGGVQGYLADLCAHLRRHDLDVVTLWLSNRTDWLRGSTIQLPRPNPVEIAPGLRALGWSRPTRARMLPWVLSYYALVPLAAQRIAELMVPALEEMVGDQVLVHNHRIGREFLALASLKVARKRGLPFVLTPYHHARWKGYRYAGWIEVYRAADALFALTHAERDELVRLGVSGDKIHVVGGAAETPLPADAARFRRRLGSNKPIILFLGQLYEYKGVGTLLAASEALHRRDLDFELVFIGPETDYSRRLLARGSHRWAHVLGRVDDQDKWDALEAAAMVCLPSSQESFGRVFLEAWAVGKPVVGGRISAVSEVVTEGETGLLVEPGSVEELARAIERLLTEPGLATRLGEEGRREVRSRFSWRRVADQVEGVYEALWSTPRPVRLP